MKTVVILVISCSKLRRKKQKVCILFHSSYLFVCILSFYKIHLLLIFLICTCTYKAETYNVNTFNVCIYNTRHSRTPRKKPFFINI